LRLIRASALYALAGVVGKAGALLTVPIVTRALGPADYGLLDLAVALIGLGMVVGGFSAELPTARLVAQRPDSRRAILTTYAATAVALTGAIAVGIALSRETIARDIWLRPDSEPIVLVAAGAVALTGIQLATWHIHRISDRPAAFAALSVTDMAFKVGLIWLAAVAGLGVIGIVTVYFAVAGVGAMLGLFSVRADLRLSILPSVVPDLIRGGALFTLIAVAFVASSYAVRALVTAEAGGAAVGAMGVALRVASVLALALRGFQLAWAPASMAASQSQVSQDRFLRAIVGVLVAGGLAAVALGAFAPETVRVVAGHDFLPAADAVPGLAMATALAAGFFMIGVACSVAGIPVWKAGVAAVAGAAVQILVTWSALGTGTQSAVGLGGVTGQAIAIAALLGLSSGRAVSDSWRIVALSAAAILAVTVVQFALGTSTYVRWAIGGTAAILFIATSGRALLRIRGS
jgi:O-antigen/teichoic acid export membrane protein